MRLNKIILALIIIFCLSIQAFAAFHKTGLLDQFNDTESNPMTGWTDSIEGLKSNGTQAYCSVAISVSGWNATFGSDVENYVKIPVVSNDYTLQFVAEAGDGYAIGTGTTNYAIYRLDDSVLTAVDSGSHTYSNNESSGIWVTAAGTV